MAANDGGDAEPSNTTCTTPPAGTTLSATLVNAQTLELHWADNSAVEDGFEIWMREYRASMMCCQGSDGGTLCDTGIFEVTGLVAHLPPNVTTVTVAAIPADTSCAPATEYYYYVVVTKDGGGSGPSNEVNATTGASVSGALVSRTLTPSQHIPVAGGPSARTETGRTRPAAVVSGVGGTLRRRVRRKRFKPEPSRAAR